MKILVADDDAVSRRMMQKILESSGYEVVTAADGDAAILELSKVDPPRLALIDWMMPGLDGIALCRYIRRQHDRLYTYIILLTSKESSEDLVAGLEAGADDYLIKPCNAAELRARLQTGRRIRQLEDRLVEAHEEMRLKATHDSLTSLLNRGAIMSLLKNELQRGLRSQQPVSIMLCDIDYFKQINDTYGHSAGDTVLREIASRLAGSIRSYDAIGLYTDAVGRYGGEEFLMVLSGCDANQVQKKAESIRQAIAVQVFEIDGSKLWVTISMGLTTIDHWDQTSSIESLLDRADAALYRAKSEGRNRFVFADPLVTAPHCDAIGLA
jgi:diguanylate cyclase (GGDEF)-like protein